MTQDSMTPRDYVLVPRGELDALRDVCRTGFGSLEDLGVIDARLTAMLSASPQDQVGDETLREILAECAPGDNPDWPEFIRKGARDDTRIITISEALAAMRRVSAPQDQGSPLRGADEGLVARIASAPVHSDWTAQLYPPHERARYDHVMLKVTPAERDQIVAALSPSPAGPSIQTVTEWMPIETAPKDGTIILVCGMASKGYYVVDVKWGDGDEWMMFDPCTDGYDTDCYNPTHWQPLPAPPALTGQPK